MQPVLGLRSLELDRRMGKHLSITAVCWGRQHNLMQHLEVLTPQSAGYMLSSTPPC